MGGNKIMLWLNFTTKLKELNPRLFVIGNDDGKPWGLYLRHKYGMEPPKHMCGLNPGGLSIDELTHRRWDGYILHQGWRRVLKILVEKKAIDLRKAEALFKTNLRSRYSRVIVEKDPLTRAMDEAKQRGLEKTGDDNFIELDDLVDIHRMREKFRQDKNNYWA